MSEEKQQHTQWNPQVGVWGVGDKGTSSQKSITRIVSEERDVEFFERPWFERKEEKRQHTQ